MYRVLVPNSLSFILPNDSKTFAIYTETDDEPKQRVYLLPEVDNLQTGQRRYVIRAVHTRDQDPKGKYLFSTSISKFPGIKPDRRSILWIVA